MEHSLLSEPLLLHPPQPQPRPLQGVGAPAIPGHHTAARWFPGGAEGSATAHAGCTGRVRSCGCTPALPGHAQASYTWQQSPAAAQEGKQQRPARGRSSRFGCYRFLPCASAPAGMAQPGRSAPSADPAAATTAAASAAPCCRWGFCCCALTQRAPGCLVPCAGLPEQVHPHISFELQNPLTQSSSW
jgi:hypothetical protein